MICAHLIMLLPLTIFAQAGNSGLAFLKMGVGGRGAALASSFVADADGAVAAYWNPANLAGSSNELFFSHTEWLEDIRSEFIAVKFNARGLAVGASLQFQSVDGIMLRSRPSAEPDAIATSHDVAMGLSVAGNLNQAIEVGASLKYVGERVVNFAVNGFAFDLGIRYKVAQIPGLKMSGSVHNIGDLSGFRDDSMQLPRLFRLGLAYRPGLTFNTGDVQLFAAARRVTDGSTSFSTGLELKFKRSIFVRGGISTGVESQRFAGGFGIQKGRYSLDYSYTPFNFDLGTTHRYSMAILL